MTNKQFSNKIVRYALVLIQAVLISNPLTAYAQSRVNSNNQYQFVECDSTVRLCSEEPWVLVFEDEFDGDALDEDNWDIYIGVPRDLNFKSQKAWHQRENIEVSNGSLKIITRREYKPNMPYIVSYNPLTYDTTDFEYTSGEIWSKRKFLFGKYEARVKIPKGWGLWPAFWLYGEDRTGNEIDIFEYWNEYNFWNNPAVSQLSKVQHMAVHYDYDHDGEVETVGSSYTHDDMSLDYHIYTLVYLPGYMKWEVDGQLIYEHYRYYEFSDYPLTPVECLIVRNNLYLQNLLFPFPPMHVIFNTAVKCKEGESPNHTTPFPAVMEVDWFRYYVSANNALVQTKDIKLQFLTNDIHSAYAAYDVVLDTITIPTDAKISISALHEVELLPGFNADCGSIVDIFIHQDSYQQSGYTKAMPNKGDIGNIKVAVRQNDLSGVSVSPNPTSGYITVSCSEELVDNGVILVYSFDGMLLNKTKIIKNKTIIDMNYPTGLYVLAIMDNNNRLSSFKIVKR